MLSLTEIRNRSLQFSKEWEDATYERGEAQTFWNEFFQIFGISRRRVATFEEPVKKLGGRQGFIDLFWKGQLLVEHKSFGKNLAKAKTQALDYFPNLPERDLPKYVLVCDFASFELYDLDEDTEYHFQLRELHKNIELFAFIAGYQKKTYKSEEPTNRKAAELMGKLYDKLLEKGYSGHPLELFLTRLLFCMFAEDTGIFGKDSFRQFIDLYTSEDGHDLGPQLAYIFQILDTPENKRDELDERYVQFPYVNGAIFTETFRMATFDSSMREMLLDACAFDWSVISPAIFGSMFQASMDVEKRGELGAHFTSEVNILKALKPLFLDDLWEELNKVKHSPKQLEALHAKISNINVLDPACGSGNFLVIAYRELKLLELEIMQIRKTLLPLVHINQFYGFEIEELPSRITETAMLLIDHQMNLLFAQTLGEPKFNIPIQDNANISHVNSLRIDWDEELNGVPINYIVGNPPFLGSKLQSSEQKIDMKYVFEGVRGSGVLDLVSAWFYQSAKYMQNHDAKTALVSTNSITQGEQVGILWKELYENLHIKIHFAHKTFKWKNEATRNAAVYCVIIGFSNADLKTKRLFEYETPTSEPHEIKVKNINPYLVSGDDIYLHDRSSSISNSPKMGIGNKPIDDGHYIFNEEEKLSFVKEEPMSEKYFKLFLGAREFINNKKRYILWLGDANPAELKRMPKVMERIQAVKEYRLGRSSKPTQKLGLRPTRFHVENMPDTTYLAIPESSSENRDYIPIGFMEPDVLCSNLLKVVANASLYHFAILTSKMHMDWMRYTCGRLKSDYRYSVGIVYNNFPFPEHVTEKQYKNIEALAQEILDARTQFPDSSLAELYDPLTMPSALLKAHEKLDIAVDKIYKKSGFKTSAQRMEHLFLLYKNLLEE